MVHSIFGDYDAEVTPVPIPNTEVKLCSADGTWREAARESRSSPELKKHIARAVCFFVVEIIRCKKCVNSSKIRCIFCNRV